MVDDDITIAQWIVSGKSIDDEPQRNFSHRSGIYIKSNERIEFYHDYLSGKEKVLSVIGSGDQILNCILEGTKKIDAFDISRFPKYYLALKIGAIKALSREEFIDFFYRVDTSDRFDDYYDRIREFLEFDDWNFWDHLFDYFSWYEIQDSPLFISEPVVVNDAIKQNKFLRDDVNYLKLRRAVDYVDLNSYMGDILSLEFGKKYDLVYLSNIVYYTKLDAYKRKVENFKLSNKGIVLSYFYGSNKYLLDHFNDKYFYDSNDGNGGVLVYKNRK